MTIQSISWQPQLRADRPAYMAIVDALRDDIDSGVLKQGARLPTQRDLSRALGVSIGTVTRAYTEAESRGLVRGEVGRGTYVGSRTPARTLDTESEPVDYPLDMVWPLDHLSPDLGVTLRAIQQRSDLAELLRYQPNAGLPRHRTSGAAWLARHGLDVPPERVLVCTGAQHAMTILFSLHAEPGDTILTEELTYPGVQVAADFSRLRLAPVDMDDEGLRPDSFEAACRQRRPKALYTIPTLHNPTASTMPDARRREIAAIAERYDVAILEDAIHHMLADDPPPPISHYAPGNGYLIASPAKVVVGGLRIAYIAAPEHAIERLAHNVWATTWMAPPLTAEVMSTWIEDGTADATVATKKAEAAARSAIARRHLPDSVIRGDGGYHLWVDLPEAWSRPERFAAALARRRVSLMPADAFVVGGAETPHAVRLALTASPDRARMEEGIRRVATAIDSRPGLGTAIV